MALWSRNIEITQNEDESFTFGFATADPSGNPQLAVPFNFTGCTAKMQVRENSAATSEELLALSTSSGIAFSTATVSGVSVATIVVTITNAQTVELPAGTWFYDLFVYTNTGQQTCYLQGAFIVNSSVTR
jgi:hypothetical protein